jgi:hypothetical protein
MKIETRDRKPNLSPLAACQQEEEYERKNA